MKQRPKQQKAVDGELLTELLAASLPKNSARLQPIALESLHAHRERALAGYVFRNWLDRWLTVAERTLAVVVLGFFGWWLATGYGYDLWHAWYAAPVVVPAPAVAAVAPPAAPPPHPELGRSLPVVTAPWQRPVVVADYLQPARPWIAPLPSTPTATPQAPTPTPIIDRQPLHLTAPTISLDAPVVEVFLQDGVWQVADYAVGALHGTGSAGSGNLVLAGHKGIRGAVFRDLEQLSPGQDIWLDSAAYRFHYRVATTFRVWPNQVEIMYPTTAPTLTMMTCTNWDTQRFVVQASLVDVAPLPAGN